MHVACFTANPGDKWNILLPTPLLMEVLKWYHIMIGHSGIQRLYVTVRARFNDDAIVPQGTSVEVIVLHLQHEASTRYYEKRILREAHSTRSAYYEKRTKEYIII